MRLHSSSATPGHAPELFLTLTQVVAGYPGSRVLLRDLSFSLPGPRLLAVVGHNGCGKTTLLRVLTGALAPLQGTVLLNGRPLPPEPAVAGLLAWLPQRTDVRFPVSVRELVLLGRYRQQSWRRGYSPTDYARTDEALHRCGVAHLRDRDFTSLSGGEQQLVWLAQLRTQDAPLYLLDEPTQQLDVYHRRRVFELLTEWVTVEGKTVVCITHDLANLAELPAGQALLNLSPRTGVPVVVELTPAAVQAAQRELEAGPRPLPSAVNQ